MKYIIPYFVLVAVILCCLPSGLSAQWVQSGLLNKDVSALLASGTDLIAGTNHCSDGSCIGTGAFRSSNGDTSWTDASSGLSSTDVRSFAVIGESLFAGTYGGGVFRSTDNGSSWSGVDSGLTMPYVFSLTVGPTTPRWLFAGTYGGVFRSSNNGSSWTKVNSGLTDSIVLSLGIGGENLFAGTCCHGVFRSTDNGDSWTHADSGMGNAEVWCFAVSGTNTFAGTYGDGIFLSTDWGTSWTAVNSDLPLPAMDIRAFAVSGTDVLAGTDNGVYLSSNTGSSWSQLTGLHVTSFAVLGSNLYTGTITYGVWKVPLSDLLSSVGETHTRGPERFALSQNYPNPFNPGTAIEYSIPTAGYVTLKVFDLLGKEIRTLAEGRQEPGRHVLSLDSGDMPSGVYYYRMSVGAHSETKKFVLLR